MTKNEMTLEVEVTLYEGYSVPLSIRSGLMDIGDNAQGLMVTLTDISSMRELETQMLRSEHMRSLGTIAAGIAHEIKKPLVAIRTFTQLVPSRWESQTFRDKFQEVMLPQVERIHEMCQSLTQIGTRKQPKMGEENLADILNEVSALLESDQERFGGKIRISDVASLSLLVDRAQIVQVLVNLILNGLQALNGAEDGVVMINANELKSGQVKIMITDNGCGMTEETCTRIFDPFFSTKDSGTGMGMTIVQSIIEEHQGYLDVSSELGVGTTFEVVLPTLSAIRSPREVFV